MCPIPTPLTLFVGDYARVVEQNVRILMKKRTYQRLGMPSALGSADHELSEELFYEYHPPQAVPWGTTCLVLQNPLS